VQMDMAQAEQKELKKIFEKMDPSSPAFGSATGSP